MSDVQKTHRMPYCICIVHFPQKSPIISGSFSKNDYNLRHPMSLVNPTCIAKRCTRIQYVLAGMIACISNSTSSLASLISFCLLEIMYCSKCERSRRIKNARDHVLLEMIKSYSVAKTHRMTKVAVIFCKSATNYRALLRKMMYTRKASFDSTPPCSHLLQVSKSFQNVEGQMKQYWGPCPGCRIEHCASNA